MTEKKWFHDYPLLELVFCALWLLLAVLAVVESKYHEATLLGLLAWLSFEVATLKARIEVRGETIEIQKDIIANLKASLRSLDDIEKDIRDSLEQNPNS